MPVFRGVILGVGRTRFVRRIATGGVGRKVALRFVAGEDLDDGLAVAKTLNAQGLMASLDYLGENVRDPAQARAAAEVYSAAVERIAAAGLQADLSVKLSQMGLDLDPELALANTAMVVHRAMEVETSVTLDMEDHRYTDRTIDACLRLDHRYPGRAGIAIQAYLKRSPDDIERLLGVAVRLCKGAYKEPRSIAHTSKEEVDAAFARMTNRLLSAGRYPMIATHDERLIRHTIRSAKALGRRPETFEFQLLYGIRRDLQRRLREEGYRVRVYIPFGSEWYPYLLRRLAERPANLRFFLRQLVSK
jgi:proline dehydrogenase